jgi:iron only hydrogenase large subunit-like protein
VNGGALTCGGTINVAGTEVRIAIARGWAKVEAVLNKIREAEVSGAELPYHFIEVMACPGGCVAGGGQPYGITGEVRTKRAAGVCRGLAFHSRTETALHSGNGISLFLSYRPLSSLHTGMQSTSLA